MAHPLETRFQTPAPPLQGVDGVVVLGGGLDLGLSAARNQSELNRAGNRLAALVELARRDPEARLIYFSGSGSLRNRDHREADHAVRLLARMGLEPDRVEIERDSRNTRGERSHEPDHCGVKAAVQFWDADKS